eukprot:Skav200609  [mRNA]  locus=scaffold879:159875:197401:- [translate_table: standard]
MPYIGHSLALWRYQQNPFPFDAQVALSLQRLGALGHMHDRRILHADVKPSNVLYDALRQSFYLSDFGLCVSLPGCAYTLNYRPPELCVKDPDLQILLTERKILRDQAELQEAKAEYRTRELHSFSSREVVIRDLEQLRAEKMEHQRLEAERSRLNSSQGEASRGHEEAIAKLRTAHEAELKQTKARQKGSMVQSLLQELEGLRVELRRAQQEKEDERRAKERAQVDRQSASRQSVRNSVQGFRVEIANFINFHFIFHFVFHSSLRTLQSENEILTADVNTLKPWPEVSAFLRKLKQEKEEAEKDLREAFNIQRTELKTVQRQLEEREQQVKEFEGSRSSLEEKYSGLLSQLKAEKKDLQGGIGRTPGSSTRERGRRRVLEKFPVAPCCLPAKDLKESLESKTRTGENEALKRRMTMPRMSLWAVEIEIMRPASALSSLPDELIQAEDRCNRLFEHGFSPMHWSAQRGRRDLIEFMRQQVVSASEESGCSASSPVLPSISSVQPLRRSTSLTSRQRVSAADYWEATLRRRLGTPGPPPQRDEVPGLYDAPRLPMVGVSGAGKSAPSTVGPSASVVAWFAQYQCTKCGQVPTSLEARFCHLCGHSLPLPRVPGAAGPFLMAWLRQVCCRTGKGKELPWGTRESQAPQDVLDQEIAQLRSAFQFAQVAHWLFIPFLLNVVSYLQSSAFLAVAAPVDKLSPEKPRLAPMRTSDSGICGMLPVVGLAATMGFIAAGRAAVQRRYTGSYNLAAISDGPQ